MNLSESCGVLGEASQNLSGVLGESSQNPVRCAR